jgi:uncharacterized protein YkwD
MGMTARAARSAALMFSVVGPALAAGAAHDARAPTLPEERVAGYLLADCGPPASYSSRWHGDRRLDQAAALWARGAALHAAVELSGYTAGAVSGLHLQGIHAPRRPGPGASACRMLRDRFLVDMGALERYDDLWVVFASPVSLPAASDEARVARHALELVNRARQSQQRCGTRLVPPADPLRLSAKLAAAAAQHAGDMSQRHYFEHQDPGGHTPADRVRATGYAERRVGENIAYGVLSTEDAIAGWLKSPGHCENLMDPDFQEMGIAFAREQGGHSDLYWVQVLAAPRQMRRPGRFAPPPPNH